MAAMKNHILIVDDNALNQKVASKMLATMNYAYDIAADGQQAVDLYTQNDYDLILMDCVMPRVDGYEASRRIRDIERHHTRPHTPIIALSAHSEDSDEIRRCSESGMDDFLPKPMDMQRLQRLIVKWLQQGTDASPAQPETPQTQPALHHINDIRESLGEHYIELIRIFLRDSPALVARLQKALQENNQAEIAYAAHTLRGSSRYVGAQQLSTLCDRIEAAASDSVRATPVFHQLEQQFEVVTKLLQQQL